MQLLQQNYSFYKDEVLDSIGEIANVAQFVSFGPDRKQRYSRIRGYEPNRHFDTMEASIKALLQAAPDGSVNVRSYFPHHAKSGEFIYGLKSLDVVLDSINSLANHGLYTIVNETIDVHDGGVSGVVYGNLMEFAPDDTPQCVEKPGTVSLQRGDGIELLSRVYTFRPKLDFANSLRVEFSIHPLRRGFLNEHTIIWELEDVGEIDLQADTNWPNLFSRKLGDKAFGLLLADILGLPVPKTTVISRSIAPFTFGQSTETSETWIRTCPVVQIPGLFTTKRGWCDPFKLISQEDPNAENIASILAQEGVEPVYSGALITSADGKPIIEGVAGFGDEFMQGRSEIQDMPHSVLTSVKDLYYRALKLLGAVRMEWVFDGSQTWVVQFHRGATSGSGNTIYPGNATFYHHFNVENGIQNLRNLITKVQGTDEGITLVGEVGITSHLGDLLRRAQIPSYIERKKI